MKLGSSVIVIGTLLAVIWVLMTSTGCTTATVIPPKVVDKTISWDGTNQNSGFVGWDNFGQGIITPRARQRYNALVLAYGERFKPPLACDYGVHAYTNGLYIITQEALSKFITMNRWQKEGR